MAEKASLIIGLGNPEPEYADTRHNAGFMAVNALAGAGAVWKKEKNYLAAKSGHAVFIKPQTFMNLSGLAVQAAMAKYKIPPEDIVVIHDDIDLRLGDIRTKIGGGNAGHNGLKSISAAIGNDYRRIRIGVGRPESKDYDISDWVLGKFAKSEQNIIDDTVMQKIPTICAEWL
ncbi:MAG: aminoacyl-tRNA hydrolase [Rickettsiales bacterium]|jgi:PTH1 family peptidyl-tRNA hydrolase|nr:aminoacyl-tRNA hydrolase [Rickettsiales bacterium]